MWEMASLKLSQDIDYLDWLMRISTVHPGKQFAVSAVTS
jgi:hypothetical protein